jgi:hypothetical protein
MVVLILLLRRRRAAAEDRRCPGVDDGAHVKWAMVRGRWASMRQAAAPKVARRRRDDGWWIIGIVLFHMARHPLLLSSSLVLLGDPPRCEVEADWEVQRLRFWLLELSFATLLATIAVAKDSKYGLVRMGTFPDELTAAARRALYGRVQNISKNSQSYLPA